MNGMRSSRRTPPVDRTSDRWQRLRANCQHAAAGFDIDQHVDFVYRTLKNTTGLGRDSLDGTRAAEARKAV